MLVCFSASHQNAQFDFLEKLAATPEALLRELVADQNLISGAVVLATCNRFEAYLDIDEPLTFASSVAFEKVAETVEKVSQVPVSDFYEQVQILQGDEVAEHLFAVSSGLKSVVVGEGEISGQVRKALIDARSISATSSELERLFQRASEAAKAVQSQTALGSAGRGIVQLALKMADTRIVDWSKLNVLLVGTGSYARACLAALRSRGAENISLYSPSGRGRQFAFHRELKLIENQDLNQALGAADLIVSSSSAERVFNASMIEAARTIDSPARLTVIDLGLPRNIDPDVSSLNFVELLGLETIRIHAPLKELNASEEAEQLINNALEKFHSVSREQSVTPAVIALRSHLHELLAQETSRLKAEENDSVSKAMRHLVGVILHQTTENLRAAALNGEAESAYEAINTLFGLELDYPSSVQKTQNPHLKAVDGL